mgnify:FL=1
MNIKKPRSVINKERDRIIVELFSKGGTTYEIGGKYEISHQRVSQILKQHSVNIHELRDFLLISNISEETIVYRNKVKCILKKLHITPIYKSKGREWYTEEDLNKVKVALKSPSVCMVCGKVFIHKVRRVRCSEECGKIFYSNPRKYMKKKEEV